VLEEILANDQKTFPDARWCDNPSQATVGAKTGIVRLECATFTPQSGPAFPVFALEWVATNSSGTTVYGLTVGGKVSDSKAVGSAVGPVLDTVTWTAT
jgi:hypothetical protein